MSILTVDYINQNAKDNLESFINKSEEKFKKTVDKIARRIKEEKIKYVFLCGPTSSGKTTFSSLLIKDINLEGSFCISLDDYYKSIENMPLWKNNHPNYETINSLRLDAIKRDFNLLKEGKEVKLPLLDFETGRWVENNRNVKIEDNNIVLIEGLHALNKKITGIFKGEKILKIFICPTPHIEHKGKKLSNIDLRFIRRLVRDENYRNSDVLNSFLLWDYVRAGERQFMKGYKLNADIVENTYLDYETCVLKSQALKMLYTVNKDNKYYLRARRLINLLECFLNIDTKNVGKDSLLNEFIKK